MNFKELVSTVAADTKLPANQVRKVSLAVLEKFAKLIDSQANFVSPVITITAKTLSAVDGTDGKPAKPERKFARMMIRAKKLAQSSTDSSANVITS